MLPLMGQCYESALAAKKLATSIRSGTVASLTLALSQAVSMTLLNGAVGWDAGNAAAAFLRTRRPVARTTTFFIYDFTHEPLAPVADDHRA